MDQRRLLLKLEFAECLRHLGCASTRLHLDSAAPRSSPYGSARGSPLAQIMLLNNTLNSPSGSSCLTACGAPLVRIVLLNSTIRASVSEPSRKASYEAQPSRGVAEMPTAALKALCEFQVKIDNNIILSY
jgi:hypothetical protein